MKTLKYLFVAVFFMSTVIINADEEVETLTNEKIIELCKIGLQSSVIITKIQSSVIMFDVSTEALISLSENGVPSDVINKMVLAANDKQLKVDYEISSTDPNVMHGSGIYYHNNRSADDPLNKIEALRVSEFRTSGGGYGGFGGTSQWAVLTGMMSKQRISESRPVFYFYFNEDFEANWDISASSPNEFALVKVIEKKGERLVRTGSSVKTRWHSKSSSGIPEKDKLAFRFEKVSDGIYKVTVITALQSGEYCFVFASELYKVFDFRII